MSDIDFKELSGDSVVKRLTEFDKSIKEIEELLKVIDDPELYNKLSSANKIQYNLLLSFSLNSLFWMYMRVEGIDPSKHKIKSENERLKKAMMEAKQAHDRNTIMPRINKGAAQRFIRSGLWTPGQVEENETNTQEEPSTPAENWDEE